MSAGEKGGKQQEMHQAVSQSYVLGTHAFTRNGMLRCGNVTVACAAPCLAETACTTVTNCARA
jgi:hypothetical protein